MPEDVDFSERKSILRRTREEFGNSSVEACSEWASGSSSAVCVGKGSSSMEWGLLSWFRHTVRKGWFSRYQLQLLAILSKFQSDALAFFWL